MSDDQPYNPISQAKIRVRSQSRFTMTLVLLWTAILAGSLGWNIRQERRQSNTLAKHAALANFHKDLAFRLWATLHGGVYVPADERTPPNPFLDHVPERDLVSPSGRRFTLMNPAYMLRQMMEEFSELYGIRGHLTSLNPLRPENAPDKWEQEALLAFERGETEVFEVVTQNDEEVLRLMRPLVTEKGCLKCHAHQGYKEGDIRGAVGVSVSMARYRQAEMLAVKRLLLSHLILWGLGIIGIAFVHRQQQQRRLERTRAEDALARQAHLLNAIINSPVNIIVFALDSDFCYTAFNQNHVREMRKVYNADIEIGMNFFENIPDANVRKNAQASFDRVLSGESFSEVQQEPEHQIYYEFNWNPICSEDGAVEGITVFIKDVTRQKLAEREVHKLNARLEARVRQRTAELEAANKELKDFAYIVSHDLKAPLRGISKLAHWLVEDNPECFDDDGKEMSHLLINRVMRLDVLIEALLEYSRVGRFAGEHTEVDLERLVRELIDTLAPPPHIRFTFRHKLPMIRGDKIRLQQVFQNLLDNAITFMDKPEGVVTIGCADEGSHWQFSVTDNGPGIDVKYHRKIFQVFQTLQPRDEYESTGLGLALVKKIVGFYGGNVWVESSPGQGCTFYFTLAKAPKKAGRLSSSEDA